MKSIITLVLILALTGCMSEREYMLRKKNAENAAAHPATFDADHQRTCQHCGRRRTDHQSADTFSASEVPDGIERQRGIVRDVVTGAAIGCGLHQAGHWTTKTTVTGGAE